MSSLHHDGYQGQVARHCTALALVATTTHHGIFRKGDGHSCCLSLTSSHPGRLSHSLSIQQCHSTSRTWQARGSGTHVEVMVRKRSCPAVSQICSFTFSPLISTVRILKSTPIVVM